MLACLACARTCFGPLTEPSWHRDGSLLGGCPVSTLSVPEATDLPDTTNLGALHQHFLQILPRIRTHAEIRFRHPTQKVHKNKDGSVTFHFQIDGLNEIVRWILGWGNRVKVIQPPKLRKMVIDQLQQTLRAYESNI